MVEGSDFSVTVVVNELIGLFYPPLPLSKARLRKDVNLPKPP